jgi:hypothetical protein
MAREPKIDVVDLIRANFTNVNTSLSGSEGVFPDFPRLDLKYNSYPRISVIDVDSKEEWAGVGSNTKVITWTGQVAIWVKEALETDQLWEISAVKYGDEKLLDYLKQQIKDLLQNQWTSLPSAYKNCLSVSEGEQLFDIDRGAFFKPIQIQLVYLEQEA